MAYSNGTQHIFNFFNHAAGSHQSFFMSDKEVYIQHCLQNLRGWDRIVQRIKASMRTILDHPGKIYDNLQRLLCELEHAEFMLARAECRFRDVRPFGMDHHRQSYGWNLAGWCDPPSGMQAFYAQRQGYARGHNSDTTSANDPSANLFNGGKKRKRDYGDDEQANAGAGKKAKQSANTNDGSSCKNSYRTPDPVGGQGSHNTPPVNHAHRGQKPPGDDEHKNTGPSWKRTCRLSPKTHHNHTTEHPSGNARSSNPHTHRTPPPAFNPDDNDNHSPPPRQRVPKLHTRDTFTTPPRPNKPTRNFDNPSFKKDKNHPISPDTLFKAYEAAWSNLPPNSSVIPYPTYNLHASPLREASYLNPTWSTETVIKANTQAFFLRAVGLRPRYRDLGRGRVELGFYHGDGDAMGKLGKLLKKEVLRWHSDRLGRREGGENLVKDEIARAVFHAVVELKESLEKRKG
ncbi:hypothetical protein K470DRAFT_264449 [Piedraia hortae CBS 480.64]|uniref:Uncharacterized protein n=1 Tax=Piedraia hortae CBS 480.64 TaxID=1314780 RepID=A0A6A7C0C7_9PEZI|nr:hypothetical protein K470DRAFT_264449 [Piedraia hortae CBS 480.64]